ncbi:hypothetical protein BDN72DRAFT_491783 [Pluteus cervinus]|uniref:Uncharacterized protein n=1 Tax=Pluteus cervinus TaxID=181527 RepID=A0ACD3B065_9AGAR|nr:hypothetical protein BDN72DRAFT_491783 [Pluteus cervinus]
MGRKHKTKGSGTLQKCLSSLPVELVQLILEELARQAPHLGAWMLRTNSTLNRWIEPVLYHEIDLGRQLYDGTDCKRYLAFKAKPAAFFTEHVKILSIGPHIRTSFILPFLTTCTGVHSLELLCPFYPFFFPSPEQRRLFLDSYWQAISSPQLRPTRLVIDLYQHMAYPKFTSRHPLFSNVTHLEVELSPEGSFIDENLLSLANVIRFKVQLSGYSTTGREINSFLPATDTIAKFCPPNARICLIWSNELPLEQFISSAPISRIARGSLGNKVVLGTRLLHRDRELLERPGYQYILANWCLERKGGEDIWQQAEKIVARRLNSEARVAGLFARLHLGS